MIVHTLADGQLLCIHQNSHALMAAEFCRHWGNDAFARPTPIAPVLLGIVLHDNGWQEWEAAAQLRDDGYPMDFLHGPPVAEKLVIWRRGIERAAAQHPYAGLLVGEHAAWLYSESLAQLNEEDRSLVEAFIDEQATRVADVQTKFAQVDAAPIKQALSPATFAAHTRLLQFGDSASLQVCMPWATSRTFENCPVDFQGETTAIQMTWAGQEIRFKPWPFAVEDFAVTIHGRRLRQTHFANAQAYQRALTDAPYAIRTWRVAPG